MMMSGVLRGFMFLRDLKGRANLPWLVLGDFNKILFDCKKKGGPSRLQREMNDFREALNDLGYGGEPWWNKQVVRDDVMGRLDRGVANL